jgi:hypothetical protein
MDENRSGAPGRFQEESPMSERNRVVAHLLDGKLIKGTTQDFFPNRPMFHVTLLEGGLPIEVRTRQLKAMFFVRQFAGDTMRRDVRGFIQAPGETAQGKKLAVRFKDGELLCGYSLAFSPDREGFFMFPSDAGANNLRVYVLSAAAAEIKAGPAAETLAQKVLDQRAA